MKKFFVILLSFFFIASVIAIPVFAQEERQNIVLLADQIHEGDYFAAGDNVNIMGTVNGDAYAAAGNVIVQGVINGDLLTAGGTVTISGDIQGDIRTAGGTIILSGASVGGNVTALGGTITIDSSSVIQGSLVSAGGNLQILAPVGRGATIGAGSVVLGNSVGGNILAGVGEMTLSQNAIINGDLTYYSESEATIAAGATVSGKITQQIPPNTRVNTEEVERTAEGFAKGLAFSLKVVDIFWLLIVGLIATQFFPIFMKRTAETVRGKIGWSLLTGLIVMIIFPVIGILLFVTLAGIPIAIVLLFIFLFIMWFARIFALHALGTEIAKRLKLKSGTNMTYVIGLIAYSVLTIIPVIGFFTQIIVVLSGIGAFLAIKKKYYEELRTKKLI